MTENATYKVSKAQFQNFRHNKETGKNKKYKRFISLLKKLKMQQKLGLVKLLNSQYDEEGDTFVTWVNLQNEAS